MHSSNLPIQGGNSLNNNSPSNVYTLAMILSLAHPYGTPTILSSYSGFTTYDAGAPNSGMCSAHVRWTTRADVP